MKLKAIFAIVAMSLAAVAGAQVITPPDGGPNRIGTDTITNLYAAGASYNVGGTPAVAGTALYAHLITSQDPQTGKTTDTGTYVFTAVDALPNTLKPFTVNTNIGAGIAQRVATIGKFPIFMPSAAGISWNGSNTGWQWNAGVAVPIRIKSSQYYLMPTARFLKSSVSNGTGYQPIIGLLFGWGN